MNSTANDLPYCRTGVNNLFAVDIHVRDQSHVLGPKGQRPDIVFPKCFDKSGGSPPLSIDRQQNDV